MIEFLQENILFIICCSVGTAIDIGILNFLSHVVNMNEKTANIISYTVGVVVAFFLCRSFVFVDARDYVGGRLVITLLTHSIGLIVQQWLLNTLMKRGLSLNFAKCITIAENAVLMYFLTKYIVFIQIESI